MLRWRVPAGLGMAVCLALPVMAQAQSRPAVAPAYLPGYLRYANGGLMRTLRAVPVKGQPFSATLVHHRLRILRDGSTIEHQGHHFVARDSEGRARIELRLKRGRNGAPDTVLVFVRDPVAGTVTAWFSGVPNQPKVAIVLHLPQNREHARPTVIPSGKSAELSRRPQPTITTQKLGTEVYEGLELTGERITKTIPAGRFGNSAPITRTHTIWISPTLQMVVRQKWTDPRFGTQIAALKNISRSEPDPALFRAPAGYQVKDALQEAIHSLSQLQQKMGATQ